MNGVHILGEPANKVADWIKLAITVLVTIIGAFAWATNTFVSRVEYSQHMEQQTKDLSDLKTVQGSYATEERSTANRLGGVENRLTSIETKIDIMINGLDGKRLSRSNHAQP